MNDFRINSKKNTSRKCFIVYRFEIECILCNDSNQNRVNDLQRFKSKMKKRLFDIDAQTLVNRFRYMRRMM